MCLHVYSKPNLRSRPGCGRFKSLCIVPNSSPLDDIADSDAAGTLPIRRWLAGGGGGGALRIDQEGRYGGVISTFSVLEIGTLWCPRPTRRYLSVTPES